MWPRGVEIVHPFCESQSCIRAREGKDRRAAHALPWYRNRKPLRSLKALQPREHEATSVGSTVASGAQNSPLTSSEPRILNSPAIPTGTRINPAWFSILILPFGALDSAVDRAVAYRPRTVSSGDLAASEEQGAIVDRFVIVLRCSQGSIPIEQCMKVLLTFHVF